MSMCEVPAIRPVCGATGNAASTVLTAPFMWLAQGMAGAASWTFTSVWHVIDTTTYVDVTSSQYTRVYSIMFGIAVVVMVGFFLLQIIGGMVRREPGALSRAALGLAKAVIGSFVALTLLATALEITDQLCIGIVEADGTSMSQMGDRVGLLAAGLATINVAAPSAAAVLTIVLAGLAIAAALVVWGSLLIRKALILLGIVFAPVALAGSSWDHTRSWVSRWATFVIAMILSKLVLVVIFVLATSQVSAPIDADLQSVSQPIAGVVLMLLGAFAPYLTYKTIAWMGFDTHHVISAEQEAKSALRPPAPITQRLVGAVPASVFGGSSGRPRAGEAASSASPGAARVKKAAVRPRIGSEVATTGERTADPETAPGSPTTPPHVADSTLDVPERHSPPGDQS